MNMFCFLCQEAANGTGCTMKGVCGKEASTSGLMDILLYAVRGEAIINRLLREKGVNRPCSSESGYCPACPSEPGCQKHQPRPHAPQLPIAQCHKCAY